MEQMDGDPGLGGGRKGQRVPGKGSGSGKTKQGEELGRRWPGGGEKEEGIRAAGLSPGMEWGRAQGGGWRGGGEWRPPGPQGSALTALLAGSAGPG